MTILHLIRATEQRMDELRKTIAAALPHAAPLQEHLEKKMFLMT
jgi:uncharacterized membrane protein (GlpM family)